MTVLAIFTSSNALETSHTTINAEGIQLQRKLEEAAIGLKIAPMRGQFQSAKERMASTKAAIQGEDNVSELVESLTKYVAALASTMELDSPGMNEEERRTVALAHFDAAHLHLSSVLPIFSTSVAKTSLLYTDESYSNQDVLKWKQDWLLKLTIAIEEDAATASNFENPAHYILHEIFPLNIKSALYHLNKASILGHNSARSLFSILSKIGSRALPTTTILPDPSYEGLDSSQHSSSGNNGAKTQIGDGKSDIETSKTESSSSSHSTSSTGSDTNSKDKSSNQLSTKVLKLADWKMLEHVFQDLSAGGQSPSALISEGYHHYHGIDTYAKQCSSARKSLREATQPLLEIFRRRVPSPSFEFNEYAVPSTTLMEEYSGQSMGGHRPQNEYERLDLIDYYTYQAHEPGQTLAKSAIGALHLFGSYGYPRNYEKAMRYFSEADKSQPSSQLAYMHQLGLSVPRDVPRAIAMYERAAEKNDSFAMTQLGLLHIRGDASANLPVDIVKGIGYLKKATERDNNVEANFQLATISKSGIPGQLAADPSAALKHIILAATHGHMGALMELAALTGKCEDSVNVYMKVLTSLFQPLVFRAREFYRRAMYDHAAVLYNLLAALGIESGQLNAAWLHERGLVANHLNARDFANLMPLNFPALAKSPHAASTLASSHLRASIDSLSSRLQQLAEDGDFFSLGGSSSSSKSHRDLEDSTYDLSDDFLFASSSDSIENLDEKEKERSLGDRASSVATEQLLHAFELYKLAAQQGNAEAALKVGDFYYYGNGVQRNYNRSVQFYHLSAGAKHAQARFNLGFMYQHGLGVPQDFHLAQRYYDAAIAASPDAHIPTTLATFTLQIQSLLFGKEAMEEPAWDTKLLILCFIALAITALLRWSVRAR